jgi:hypothetical protein
MPEQVKVVFVEPQGHAHLFDFLDKTRQIPQRRVFGLIGIGRPQLVVVNELDAFSGQKTFERLEILVRAGRAAVQQQHLGGGVVAKPLGPHIEGAFGGLDGDEAHPAGLHAGFGLSEV